MALSSERVQSTADSSRSEPSLSAGAGRVAGQRPRASLAQRWTAELRDDAAVTDRSRAIAATQTPHLVLILLSLLHAQIPASVVMSDDRSEPGTPYGLSRSGSMDMDVPSWIPDHNARECMACRKPFGFSRRRVSEQARTCSGPATSTIKRARRPTMAHSHVEFSSLVCACACSSITVATAAGASATLVLPARSCSLICRPLPPSVSATTATPTCDKWRTFDSARP